MKTSLDCIPCFVRQAADAIAQTVSDTTLQEALLRKTLTEIAYADWQGSPPVMSQAIHRIIRRELGDQDPYRAIKRCMNETASRLLAPLREQMETQPDRQEAAVRIAIGGNLLDAGSRERIDVESLPEHMLAIWSRPLQGDPGALFAAAAKARRILYLADNAGEIFLDRILLEALPSEKIQLFVRGAPVINDATLEDAHAAGLGALVPVAGNGSDAPGTILDECDASFRQHYEEADLIIAKGQGNYETLSDCDKSVFFLLVVKCPVIAAHIGAPVGTLVVHHHTPTAAPGP